MRVTIETERLILRNIVPDEYEAMFKWCGDPQVAEYMIYPLYTKSEDCRTYIESINPDKPKVYDLCFVLKETGEIIGMGGFTYVEEFDAWEVGYNLRRDMWGNGYVPEAMKGILEYIREHEDVKAITGTFAVENIKSRRVMEKLGMSYWKDTEYEKLDGSRKYKAQIYRRDF
ncbi:MAG: GNAT family N-acetyltransferase [Clostridia bacterium]|nr:GNAT family N-acetyltransferase [Clostridia bacterium]